MRPTRKPRILFVATLPPPVHGSAVVSQQLRQSPALREAFRCDFVNLSTSRSLEEIGRRSVAKLWRFAVSWLRTLGLLLTRRYDLCYLTLTCHGSGFLKDFPFVALCRLAGRRIVIHQHNKGMDADAGRRPYRQLLPWAYRGATVVLLSWRLYPDIERVVRRQQVVVCPNGIPFEPRGRTDHTGQVPRLLFLSNLLEAKGVLVLLDALQRLVGEGRRLVCDFVGGESSTIDAVRFAHEVERRGLQGVALYHGPKHGPEKEAFFDRADLFVLPSFDEAFPLVNLEAMAHRLPVVSTPVGGIPDAVRDGETGLLCPPRDAAALAAALARLIDDPVLRRRMGDAGYETLRSRYTEEQFIRRMLHIFHQAINNPQCNPTTT